MQRIAVSMSDHVNLLHGGNVFVVDIMCDPRVLEPSSFSGDGYHPSDRGYALMAELTYPAMVERVASAAGRLRPEAAVPGVLSRLGARQLLPVPAAPA